MKNADQNIRILHVLILSSIPDCICKNLYRYKYREINIYIESKRLVCAFSSRRDFAYFMDDVCTHFVKVANEHSTSRKLLCGVPQGSVLGPILYAKYITFQSYADNTQTYLSFNPKATGEPRMHSLSRVQSCISDVTNWMTSNKTELVNRAKALTDN